MFCLKLKYEFDKMGIIKIEGRGEGGVVRGSGGVWDIGERLLYIQWREKLYGGGQNFSEGDLSNFWFNKKVPMKNLI